MTITEKEAIIRIKNGEINFFSYIVEKYINNMVRYFKTKLFNQLDVDDLVQNTFVSFYKSIPRFDESRPVGPYLYKIALNQLKMYYRAHKETVSINENIEVPADEKYFFVNDYSGLMENLTKEQKIILELLEQGYKYQEIAEKIKRPINTVRTIIRRTRLQLKNQYEKT